MDIILSGLNSEGNEIGLTARFIIHFGFQIEYLKTFIQDHNVIDATLAVTIISIAYSTSRGIVLERTQ